jgi:hypothetical protein
MPKKLTVLLSLVCACFVGCGPKALTVEEKAEAGHKWGQPTLGLIYVMGQGRA